MYRVSVIIPIYKVEKYIERCAISLLEQTLPDIEIIFVDDCSPDDSIRLLDNVLLQYPDMLSNIKIIHHEVNSGSAVARITGIKAAEGEYIAFCDSDDWVDKEMYAYLYSGAQASGADMVYSNYVVEFEKKHLVSNLPRIEDIAQYRMSLLYGTLPSFSWIRLYKRSIFMDNLHLLYKPGVNMWEDARMNILLAPYLKCVAYVPFAGYHYNQCNENAYTHLWSEKSRSNVAEVVADVTNGIGSQADYTLPLCFFRLNALYSIFSHSTLLQIKQFEWEYMQDIPHIWKHPNMSFANKLYLFLLGHRFFYIATAWMKLKRNIRKMILK